MEIIAISINNKNIEMDLRERLSIPRDEIPKVHQEIHSLKGILENVVVVTCHRIEIYAVCTQIHIGRYVLRKYLADRYEMSLELLDTFVEVFTGQAAINRSFLLGAGVLSKVIGETQILGQLKHSWWIASEAKTTGIMLNRLFKQVVMFAKKVHEEIKINAYPSSTAYQGVQLMKKEIEDSFEKESLLLLGAGDMGKLVYEYVKDLPFQKIYWMNRSQSAFENIDMVERVMTSGLEDLASVLSKVSLIISCVNVEEPLLHKAMMGNGVKLVIDLSFPRSVHPHVGHLQGLKLFNIDDIRDTLQSNDLKRYEKVAHIQELSQEEVEIFEKWVSKLEIHPTLEKLQAKADSIYQETRKSLFRKLPALDEHSQKVIDKHLKSIRNQLLKAPIKGLKEMSQREDAAEVINLFEEIFEIK